MNVSAFRLNSQLSKAYDELFSAIQSIESALSELDESENDLEWSIGDLDYTEEGRSNVTRRKIDKLCEHLERLVKEIEGLIPTKNLNFSDQL